MQIEFFDNSLEKFVKSLDKKTIAKVLRVVNLLEEFSHNLKMPHSKKIINNLFELRIRGKQEVRILYTFHNAQIIILHGFMKKSEKIPRKELEVALRRLKALD